jgi:hypothetical protein
LWKGKQANTLLGQDVFEPEQDLPLEHTLGAISNIRNRANAPAERPITPYQAEQLKRADLRAEEQKRQFRTTQGQRRQEEKRRKLGVEAKISADLDALREVGANAKQAAESYSTGETGPIQSAVQRIGQITGTNPQGVSKFRSAVAALNNIDVKRFSGTAVSGQEWTRVKAQLPQTSDSDQTFVEKWNRAANTFNSLIEKKSKDLGRDLQVDPWPLLPAEGAPASAGSPEGDAFVKEMEAKGFKLKRVK